MEKSKLFKLGILTCVLLTFLLVIPFNYATMDGEYSQWIIPYFSGAVNSEFFGQWQYNNKDEQAFLSASNIEKIFWNFNKYDKDDLSSYEYNDIGYLYVVKLAITLFFFLPPILAVMLLQLLVHIGLCCFVLYLLFKNKTKFFLIALFLLGYAINPFILYYVTSPFYFSWQIFPSILWIIFIAFPSVRKTYWFIGTTVLIALISFFIRPTTAIPSAVLLFALVYKKNAWVALFCSIVFCGALIAIFPKISSKLPWHPIYVGLGAYGGFEVDSLDDNVSYELFYEKTSHRMKTNIPGESWHNKEIRKEFYKVIKSEISRQVFSKPHLFLRNMAFNILQSFGLGHRPYSLLINLISAFIGLLVIVLLVFTKHHKYLVILFSTVAGYALYFPPIPAYNFAVYILSVFIVIKVLNNYNFKSVFGNKVFDSQRSDTLFNEV